MRATIDVSLPKELTIDCDRWVCGCPSDNYNNSRDNTLGKGFTKLLNQHGYSCCLGQFAEQCGIDKRFLIDKCWPTSLISVGFIIKELTIGGANDSWLAFEAMDINDSKYISLQERVNKLYKLFKENGYEITFINVPEGIVCPGNK